ncbi:MAG: PP2C family protein-serine/threonine phosphatase [Cuspidothrix sp.]
MENDAVRLYCPKESCQFANPLTHKFCQDCSTPLPKRYLWAVGSDLHDCHSGTILGDRYLVIHKSILLDIKPGLLPEIPESDNLGSIKPYLKLIPHRLHIPQVYGILNLEHHQRHKKILLLERPPLITDATVNEVHLCNSLDTAWTEASSIRQIHWLWQLANLWQPLAMEGVASTLLDLDCIRVEGVLIRLLELRPDIDHIPTLSQLGGFWQQLLKNAKPSIAAFLQELCDLLIHREIKSSEQLIKVLDEGLCQLEESQTSTIKIYTKTDPGPSRPRNEDACYPPSDTLISQPPDHNVLAIVCDGIGGHEGGNVASNLAIETIEQEVRELTSLAYNKIDPSLLLLDLEGAVANANDKISQRNDSENRQGRQRMGTTIVMALPIAHEMYITHVGDSRAYWITRHNCYQVTLDDDVASREVRLGYALYREALQHSGSGSLVQALGMSKSNLLHPTCQRFIIDEDAVFLLTSDGLSDFERVEEYWEAEILPLLSGQTTIDNVAEKLINVANTKNGHDNVTIALVHYDVKYSEPDQNIAVDIVNILTNTQALTFNYTVNDESEISAQKTQVIKENKSVTPASVPLQLVVILGLMLLVGLLGYWFKSQIKSSTTISSPLPSAIKLPSNSIERNLENLSPNWVIQINTDSNINNQSFPAQSFFQVIDKKSNPKAADNPDFWLRLCTTSNSPSKKIKLNFSDLKNKDISILQADQTSPCE